MVGSIFTKYHSRISRTFALLVNTQDNWTSELENRIWENLFLNGIIIVARGVAGQEGKADYFEGQGDLPHHFRRVYF